MCKLPVGNFVLEISWLKSISVGPGPTLFFPPEPKRPTAQVLVCITAYIHSSSVFFVQFPAYKRFATKKGDKTRKRVMRVLSPGGLLAIGFLFTDWCLTQAFLSAPLNTRTMRSASASFLRKGLLSLRNSGSTLDEERGLRAMMGATKAVASPESFQPPEGKGEIRENAIKLLEVPFICLYLW